MNRPRSLLRGLAEELATIVDPLTLAAQTPERMEQLVQRLGIYDSQLAAPAAVFGAVLDLRTQIETLAARDDLDFDAAMAALGVAGSAFAAVDAVSDLGGDVGTVERLGRDLLDYLFEVWLLARHPVAREVMALLTLLEAEPDRPERPAIMRNGDEAVRAPVKIDRIRLDRLSPLLRDPVVTLKERYVNALATDEDAAAMADRLFPQLVQVLRSLGVVCHYGVRDEEGEAWLGDSAPLVRNALIIYAVTGLRSAELEAGVVVTMSPASRGDLGLVLSPFGAVTFAKQLGRWQLETRLTGQVDTVAWGRHGLTLLAQDAHVGAEVIASTPSDATVPAYVFGAADGTRIELGGVALAMKTELSMERPTLAVTVDVSHAVLVIKPGDADGFLASVLPAEGLRAEVDLGIGWSSETGVTLRGSAGLETTLPVQLSVGGLTLSHVHIGLRARGSEVNAEVSASLALEIGPMRAVVDRIGVDATLTFPEHGGNLGVAAVDLGFKPPSGIGLAIDAGVVIGAGYLYYDRPRALYAGFAQLTVAEWLSLKAFGLITTEPQVSFLLAISGEFPPIQLGLGFQLAGVGGLVGIHRGLDADRLLDAIRSGAVDDVLFPAAPMKDPLVLIERLAALFPARTGSHVFGPTALVTWGPERLIKIKLALVIELPSVQRIAILGSLTARVRKQIAGRELAILDLQVNFGGVIDFGEKFIRFDASLYRSRLLGMELAGDVALRIRYGANPDFVLTLGGFHPDFQPPALALPPALQRLQITIASGNPHIWVDSYFAVTSNSIQFGASGQFRFHKWGVGVSGGVGFDALFQFDPFHFQAGVFLRLAASWKGVEFTSIEVNGTLSGPSPWRIKGKFHLSICWFLGIDVPIDESWGDRDEAQRGAIDVFPLLVTDLAAPTSWERTTGGTHNLVTLRHSEDDGLRCHPNEILSVRQNTVPLGVAIDKFAEQRVADGNRFHIALRRGTQTFDARPVRSHFAPAQFFERRDEDKLSAEPYKLCDAGAELTELDAVVFETWTGADVSYESGYVDDAAGEDIVPEILLEPLVRSRSAALNNARANSVLGRRAVLPVVMR
ncbi:hypothetical protein BH11MYX3_BH11MYX3_14270 [soil metagenome]